MKIYKIICAETGTVIETFQSYDEALDALNRYEYEDTKEGIYTENFYAII